jgi:hypothetical protein
MIGYHEAHWEEPMPKKTERPQKRAQATDTGKLYAQAYASRLEKQVAAELESPRRALRPAKKNATSTKT